MHVYNAIIVLKEILPVFPLSAVIDLTGPPLNQVIETFIEKEERGDLKILARAYHASLKKREHLWAPANMLTKVRNVGFGRRIIRADLNCNRRPLHPLLVLPHPSLQHRVTRRRLQSLCLPRLID